MPFQPINFAGISPLGYSALRNMPQTIASGMQVGLIPAHERRQAEEAQRKAEQAALENALNEIRMKYLPQDFESQIQLRGAQAQKAQQEAGQQEMLRNILQQRMQGGAPGMGMGGQEGMPGAQGDELGEMLFRKLAGLPEEFPSEKQARGLQTKRQERQMELEFPTRQVLTEYQKRANQTEPFITTVEKLIESPSPMEYPGGFFKPNQQAKHQALVDSAADSYLMVRGLPATVENIHLAKRVLGRHRFESDKAYRERLKDTMHEVLEGAVPYYSETGAKIPAQMKKYLKGNEKKADLADPLGLR